MSYDQPKLTTQHRFPAVDFGGGVNVVKVINVPGLMAGRVNAVIIENITEDFAGSSADGGVQVGDGTTAGKYFDSGRVLDETVDVADTNSLTLLNSAAAALTVVPIEPGRSTLTVTCLPTTGTPTGIADVVVNVDWW